MAIGDILTNPMISQTGWSINLGFEGLAVGGTYNYSDVSLAVTSLGYDSTGLATTVSRTIPLHANIHRPHSKTDAANLSIITLASITGGPFYDGETITQSTSGATAIVLTEGHFDLVVRTIVGTPNSSSIWTGGTSGATATPSASPATYTAAPARENVLGSNTYTNLAFRRTLYSGDTLIKLTSVAGFYTSGGTPSGATTDLAVTNFSTRPYHKVTSRWALGPSICKAQQSSFYLEVDAFHSSGIACVVFTVSDGSTTQVTTVAARTPSALDGIPMYRCLVDPSAFAQDTVVTCNHKTYPRVGNAAATKDSSTGTYPSNDLAPLKFIADSTNTYRTYAYVDGVGGSPAVSTNAATARLTPYATMALAASALAAYNNTNKGRNNCNGDEIRLMAGNHAFGRGAGANTLTSGTGVPVWVTKDEQADVSSVNINSGSAVASGTKNAWLQTGIDSVTLSGTSIIFGTTATQILFNNCVLAGASDSQLYSVPRYLAWENCTATGFTNPYGPTGTECRSWLHRKCSAIIPSGTSRIFSGSRAVINCSAIGTTGITFWYNPDGTTNSNVILHNCYCETGGASMITWGSDVQEQAYVNCIAKRISATNPLFRIQGVNATDILIAHCNGDGERTNIENNWDGDNSNKNTINFTFMGHATDSMIAHKSDDYQNDAAHSVLIGYWPCEYGVDWWGNIEKLNAFPPKNPGLNDEYGVADVGWTDEANSNYKPEAGSELLNRIPAGLAVVEYDYNNNPVANDGTGASGAIQPIIYSETGSGGATISGTASKTSNYQPTPSGAAEIDGTADVVVVSDGHSIYSEFGSGGSVVAGISTTTHNIIMTIGDSGIHLAGAADDTYYDAPRQSTYPLIRFRVNLDYSATIGEPSTTHSQFALNNQSIGIPGVGRLFHGDEFTLDGIDAIYVRANYVRLGRLLNDPRDTIEVLSVM